MASTLENSIEFFDEQRIPYTLHHIMEHYSLEFMRTRDDWTQLRDHRFPYDGSVEIVATGSNACTVTRKKNAGGDGY
jgi:hypothetical protein